MSTAMLLNRPCLRLSRGFVCNYCMQLFYDLGGAIADAVNQYVWRHIKNVDWRRITVIISRCITIDDFVDSILVVKEKDSVLNDHECVPCSKANTSTTSRDSTKCYHWLQRYLLNIFQHVWKSAIIACRSCSALYAITAHVTTALGR